MGQNKKAFEKNNILKILVFFMGFFCLSEICWSESTNITVRVISRDAKFIGSSMGGVKITLKDAQTGELLAQGTTQGGTGDTKRIMKQSHKRGFVLSTDDASSYSATLDLKEPRLIQVTAFGPLAKKKSANRVSAVQWVVPGKHLTGGDGWLLQMPGFVVEILNPSKKLKLDGASTNIDLEANVTMMCGCSITSGGIWDANRFEVKAIIKKNGSKIEEVGLSFAGKKNRFSGILVIQEPGTYEAIIYAYDPNNGNTGLDKVTFTVSK